ncbi:MAG: hypothetical protein AAFP07_09080 [Cyanobacteria bacterium J06606_4]
MPAPVFAPVLEEIATSPTLDRPIRLPTAVPTDDALYPSYMQHFGIVIVRLDTTSDCDDSSCLGLNIAAVAAPADWPPPPPGEVALTEVDLGDCIRGYSYEEGEFGAVQWIQEGSLYALSYRQDLFSADDAIAMATSMVSGPPVTNVAP